MMDLAFLIVTFVIWLVHGGQVDLTNDDAIARLYIGGSQVANIEDAPFTVALLILSGEQLKPICTGSIINENWILTAAHCVFLPPSVYWIAAGSNASVEIDKAFHHISSDDRDLPHNGSVELRRVAKIVQHPRYKEQIAARFDIGLCQVDASWTFGSTINKISLWDETWGGDKEHNEEFRFLNCTSFGWGKTEDADVEPSPYLRTSVFKIQHGSRACSCFKPYINRRLLCTGSKEEEHSACPGDSGGPLVCKNKLAGVSHILYLGRRCLFEPLLGRHQGVLNFDELKCGGKNAVSAWMYVCPVLGWIKENVPDAPTPPLSCRSPTLPGLPPLVITFITAGSAAYLFQPFCRRQL